ncbi:MAG: hypothetical protein NTU44_20110 [Bacteroidetes bacterium]|nr:hypothetical protein [Bacteroidota bacterium]
MKIIINNHEINIFRGATVADVIRSYSKRSFIHWKRKRLVAYDRFLNKLEPDGELTEGQVVQLKKTNNL